MCGLIFHPLRRALRTLYWNSPWPIPIPAWLALRLTSSSPLNLAVGVVDLAFLRFARQVSHHLPTRRRLFKSEHIQMSIPSWAIVIGPRSNDDEPSTGTQRTGDEVNAVCDRTVPRLAREFLGLTSRNENRRNFVSRSTSAGFPSSRNAAIAPLRPPALRTSGVSNNDCSSRQSNPDFVNCPRIARRTSDVVCGMSVSQNLGEFVPEHVLERGFALCSQS